MINNSSLEKWNRLRSKRLDEHFRKELVTGLNCSSFEADAVIDTLHEVYDLYFETSGTLKPGQIIFEVISEEAPPQMAIRDSPLVKVILTLDAEGDLQIREKEGVTELRRHRLERISNEAYQQGGLLTVEDVSNRLLNCGERTVSRDISELKKRGIILPFRSMVKDMGRSITHRVLIVEQWLSGKEYTEIGNRTNHSVSSVSNYVDKFKRIVALENDGYDKQAISFLVRVSESLVNEYVKIYRSAKIIGFRRKEMKEYLKKECAAVKRGREMQ